eukprot:55364-Pelagomonas_calceolata.AAC.7
MALLHVQQLLVLAMQMCQTMLYDVSLMCHKLWWVALHHCPLFASVCELPCGRCVQIQGSSEGGSISESQADIEMGVSPKTSRLVSSRKTLEECCTFLAFWTT